MRVAQIVTRKLNTPLELSRFALALVTTSGYVCASLPLTVEEQVCAGAAVNRYLAQLRGGSFTPLPNDTCPSALPVPLLGDPGYGAPAIAE